jgi:NADH-quinone oxidoreductase subunit H
LWFRFTFPRYRFDQLMRLGWRFLIPLALVNLITMAVALLMSREWGWSLRLTSILAVVVTLAVAMWLAKNDEVDSVVPVAESE